MRSPDTTPYTLRPLEGFPGYWGSPVGGGVVLRALKPGKRGEVFLYRGGRQVKRRVAKLVREAFGS